jgi:catechol 2,3-dioxygenase-like lactoylglutathione lyase family enzyme
VPRLDAILETALYYSDDEATARFYSEILGLRRIGHVPGRFQFYRLGAGMLLLFNPELSLKQDWPPAHGTTGAGHTCFTVSKDEYDVWKTHLSEHGIEVKRETVWPDAVKEGRPGTRSFYFDDPAGTVLEIADGDIWRP